ncbi:glycosyltransferase family 2 protein [Halalkalibacter sp. APA_J-10(15)]|uniref:glycosyltransferase family 2 protein n=1 Tax=Halalkalibacter sp. APA_J-10(15) TaxID=2933805 RepID=UPI001FF639AD|nr:glycosyltransferase family 2 protein [Halalkalibacter sp. APA_J-10(15)]MCK0470254.1 glycosyltransferase [Halalkalibacter sp. APA_J-10(15)]
MTKLNNQQADVSIITPAYNAATYMADTIESVLAQTYGSWEMLIVDDCSTDDTAQIVQSYASRDPRIRFIQLAQNSGPAITRNTAIEAASGRYLAFLDSDDMWLPNKLERQLQFMQERDLAFSFTQYRVMDLEGNITDKLEDVPDEATYKDLLKHNVIGCLTVMLDKEKVGAVEMVNIRSRQDYVLWLHICKRGFTAYGLKEPLALYRVGRQSVSSNKVKMAKQNWRVYREIEGLNLVKSLWYFSHYVVFKLVKYAR